MAAMKEVKELNEISISSASICPGADLSTFIQMINKQPKLSKLCLVEKPAGDYESQYWIKITQTPDTHSVSLIQPNG